MGWLIAAVGVFAITGAVMDWNWFMNNRRAWIFVKMFGRNGARVFYVLFGAALATLGVLLALGVIESSN